MLTKQQIATFTIVIVVTLVALALVVSWVLGAFDGDGLAPLPDALPIPSIDPSACTLEVLEPIRDHKLEDVEAVVHSILEVRGIALSTTLDGDTIVTNTGENDLVVLRFDSQSATFTPVEYARLEFPSYSFGSTVALTSYGLVTVIGTTELLVSLSSNGRYFNQPGSIKRDVQRPIYSVTSGFDTPITVVTMSSSTNEVLVVDDFYGSIQFLSFDMGGIYFTTQGVAYMNQCWYTLVSYKLPYGRDSLGYEVRRWDKNFENYDVVYFSREPVVSYESFIGVSPDNQTLVISFPHATVNGVSGAGKLIFCYGQEGPPAPLDPPLPDDTPVVVASRSLPRNGARNRNYTSPITSGRVLENGPESYGSPYEISEPGGPVTNNGFGRINVAKSFINNSYLLVASDNVTSTSQPIMYEITIPPRGITPTVNSIKTHFDCMGRIGIDMVVPPATSTEAFAHYTQWSPGEGCTVIHTIGKRCAE